MMGVPVAETVLAFADNPDAVECPECGVAFIPLDHALDLRPGTMYAVACPRCGHGMYTRRLQEVDDEA